MSEGLRFRSRNNLWKFWRQDRLVLIATGDSIPTMSKTATATFEVRRGQWVCVSASKGLKCLIGQADMSVVRDLARTGGLLCRWIAGDHIHGREIKLAKELLRKAGWPFR